MAEVRLLGSLDELFARRARVALICAETGAFLAGVADEVLDGGVMDPPYGLGTREPTIEEIIAYISGAQLDTGGDFMGERWEIPPIALWREVYRTFKPGAWLAIFASTATDDILSLGLRAVGFERRDAIQILSSSRAAWVQAQGMKKGLTLGRALDDAAGLDREVVGPSVRNPSRAHGPDHGDAILGNFAGGETPVTAPASDLAARFEGFETELAPKHEVILIFRKPLAEVTSAALYAATGWDHWCTITRLRKADQRARAVENFTVVVGDARLPPHLPDGGEAQIIKRQALHEGAVTWTELRWREKTDSGLGEWVVVAMAGPTPFEPWSTTTVAANAVIHGTGALNCDAARVATNWDEPDRPASWRRSGHAQNPTLNKIGPDVAGDGIRLHDKGRFPPNVMLFHCAECRELGVEHVVPATGAKGPTGTWDDKNRLYGAKPEHVVHNFRNEDGTEPVVRSECLAGCPNCKQTFTALAGGVAPTCACGAQAEWICAVARLDEQSGQRKAGRVDKSKITAANKVYGERPAATGVFDYGDFGGASRFYPQFYPDPASPLFCYTPKASPAERNAGLAEDCTHVAIKPQAALRYVWRLVCPPGGLGLDGFAGAGSGPAAGAAEGMFVLAVEKAAHHVAEAEQRVPALVDAAERAATTGSRPVYKPVRAADPTPPPPPSPQLALFEDA